MLAFYASHLFQFRLLWGVHGIIPFPLFLAGIQHHSFSLYRFASSDWIGYCIFALGFFVTLAYTVGYKTRIFSILFYIFTWSIYTRNPDLLDGGDNLLYLMTFYMIFVDSGAHFSLDAIRRRTREAITNRPIASLFHNFGVLAIMVQLCLLYLTSAFYKIQGHMWQDGTAIYYVLRTTEFNLTSIGRVLFHNAFLVTSLTYMTVLFQMAWPWLVWNRYARPFVAIGAICLHLSIAYFMGLYWFSFVMISAELAIFSDRDYFLFVARSKNMVNRLRESLGIRNAEKYSTN